jgi:nucleoside-diphosphate-sugar epimerase
MSTEIDQDGTWEVTGSARVLVEPSQAWRDAQAALPIDPFTVNRDTLLSHLVDLIEDAATAQATLQAQRDTAQLASGASYNQANLQGTLRALQAAIKEQAAIQQSHIRRTVALARLTVGALDSTDHT